VDLSREQLARIELPEELAFSSYLHLLHFAETPEEAIRAIREGLERKSRTAPTGNAMNI
jgi:hypothetical protein